MDRGGKVRTQTKYNNKAKSRVLRFANTYNMVHDMNKRSVRGSMHVMQHDTRQQNKNNRKGKTQIINKEKKKCRDT